MSKIGTAPRTLIFSMALVFTMVIALAMVGTQSAQAQTFTLLYSFTGGLDGGIPYGGLTQDSAGNLYGMTSQGGSGLFNCSAGCGVVFKLDTAGHETILHNFGGTLTDGEFPLYGILFRDGAGNLYGTTAYGGANGNGTIFRVSSAGQEAVFSFTGGANGGFPYGGLVPDTAGNVYGTTAYRGNGCPPYGCGTVFKVNSAGKETVLHSFAGTDGSHPNAGVVRDSAGNLYGTTLQGGTSGTGTVFKVDPTGKETVLHSFTGGADGGEPWAGLVRDSAGNLYGTTFFGGAFFAGAVFKVAPNGNETVLYSFTGGSDGQIPFGNLVRDSSGNLYGTTQLGGDFGDGTVFKVDPAGNETVLYSFTFGSDGGQPYSGLVRDGAGNLYGTAAFGGNFGGGTVFKITP